MKFVGAKMAKSNDDRKTGLGSRFFQVTREESTGGHKSLSVLLFARRIKQDGKYVCDEDSNSLFGILLHGEGFKDLASYNGPPTLRVDGQPLVLPEPDGMLYVLGPTLQFQRVEALLAGGIYLIWAGVGQLLDMLGSCSPSCLADGNRRRGHDR